MGETGKRFRRENDNDYRRQKTTIIDSRIYSDTGDNYEMRRVGNSYRRDDDIDDSYERRRVDSSRNSRRNDDRDDIYQKRRVDIGKSSNFDDKDYSGDVDLVVYRILCPTSVIGSVIGKNGKVINSLRQETHSKIKVVDPFPGADERVILIYCYDKYKDEKVVDEYDTRPLCPAQDALLRVHATISDMSATDDDADWKHKDEARILVPGSQAANIIGKLGITIKTLRNKTRTSIKVTPKDPHDPTHSCAMSFDNFVQITGDRGSVKKALYAISAIMYKFSPKEEISLDTTVPELPPRIMVPSDLPNYPSGGYYSKVDTIVPASGAVSQFMPTFYAHDIHDYAESEVAWSVHSSSLPHVSGDKIPPLSAKLEVRVLCPSARIGLVIGKGGSVIKNVRQESGAHIDVKKLRNDCDECIITVTSTESADDVKSDAVEAVLMLQEKINDNDYEKKVHIHLLVPSRNIGCIIGKSGSIIKDLCKRTKAEVQISRIEKPKCAEEEDELVEVNGEVRSVRDALVQIVLRLRDALLRDKYSDCSGPSGEQPQQTMYSTKHPVPPPCLPAMPSLSTMERKNITPLSPMAYDQRDETVSDGLGKVSRSSFYGYGSLQAVENWYGSPNSYLSKPYGGYSSTLEVVIPASAVTKVMGRSGRNLENISKISGAIVEVIESHSSRSDHIALISGTPEQKHSAENLIQAFILST